MCGVCAKWGVRGVWEAEQAREGVRNITRRKRRDGNNWTPFASAGDRVWYVMRPWRRGCCVAAGCVCVAVCRWVVCAGGGSGH
jgi:hypothetical protein